MFKDKEGNLVAYGKTKKDETLINMALAITTRGKVLENATSKDKESLKNKLITTWMKEEHIPTSCEIVTRDS
jgi:hypothetical protein